MKYEGNYIIIDLETGGLSATKNPVVEVAFIAVNNQMQEVARYESLIAPYSNLIIEPKALEANGLNLSQIQAGENAKIVHAEISDIFKKLKKSYYKPMLVGHNVGFDISFLIEFFKHFGADLYSLVDISNMDTIALARLKWGVDGEIDNFKLGSCCQKAQVDLVNAHRAMTDVEGTLKLFKYFVSSLRNEQLTRKQVSFNL